LTEQRAVVLAHEIEWAHAKDRARLRHPRLPKHGPRWLEAVRMEFDPHAATELASLILARLGPP
jgi:hypothetical protein